MEREISASHLIKRAMNKENLAAFYATGSCCARKPES